MTRLIEGLWVEHQSNLFGLSKDQFRNNDDFVHNGRWYNLAGEFIGYGDLSIQDLLTISRGLEGDEVFVVLNENAGYDQRVAYKEAIKAGQPLDTVVINGIPYHDYVAAKCRYVVVAGMVFDVREGRTQDVSPEMRQHKSGLMMINVSREFIVELFRDARKLLAA
jgi:hypothetical protein